MILFIVHNTYVLNAKQAPPDSSLSLTCFSQSGSRANGTGSRTNFNIDMLRYTHNK